MFFDEQTEKWVYIAYIEDHFGKGKNGYLPYMPVRPDKEFPTGKKEGPIYDNKELAMKWIREQTKKNKEDKNEKQRK